MSPQRPVQPCRQQPRSAPPPVISRQRSHMSPASIILHLADYESSDTNDSPYSRGRAKSAEQSETERKCDDTFKELGSRFTTACHLFVDSFIVCVCTLCCPANRAKPLATPREETPSSKVSCKLCNKAVTGAVFMGSDHAYCCEDHRSLALSKFFWAPLVKSRPTAARASSSTC